MNGRDPARFEAQVTSLFDARFPSLFRYLNRLAGEPELAADVAQEAFVRLYQRGSLPHAPEAWLVTVAMNLLRNEFSSRSRRSRLLGPVRGENVLADPPAPPGASDAPESTRRRVRNALDRLSERDRSLLLLRAEGWPYRDIAAALGLREASVGVLLARARQSFRKVYGSSKMSGEREREDAPNAG